VNAIAPALIETDMVTSKPNANPNLIPMGHFGSVDDVASVAVMPAMNDYISCNCFFGACSAFTHVMACTLAESPSDPLHRKLRQLRCLRCRFDCYRAERTSSRAGVAPAEVQRLSRRTITPVDKGVDGGSGVH
jgi:hypothetical protein